MSKRKAAALEADPPADRRVRLIDDTEPPTAAALTAAAQHEQEQMQMRATAAADQAAAPTHTNDMATAMASAAAAAAAPFRPFDRVAVDALRLIMRCCDQSTLIALACCNRFSLAAASCDVAWQCLSPIHLQCDSPVELSSRLMPSLLRHAEISLTWRLRFKALVSVDQMAALAALPRMRGLTFEPAGEDRLSDDGAALLFQALSERIDHGGALTSLTFNANKMGQAGAAALAAFIERSRTLTSLNITRATDSLLAPLTAALTQCRTLTSLELRSASFSMETAHALAAFVQHSTALTMLKLFRCELDDAAATALAAAVVQSRSLADLQLSSCGISDVGVEALAAAAEQSGHIRKLDFSHNSFSSVGAVALARLLASDRCALTTFHASNSEFAREGVAALAGALRTIRSLTELRLSNIGCGDDGTAALVAALQHNPHCRLRVLDLSCHQIKGRHAGALAEVIGRSPTLERLHLRWCRLGNEEMEVLAAGIGHSRALQHLDASHNKFDAAGAAALAAAVATCPTITSLIVEGTGIGDAGMAALAPALVNVRHVSLNDCGLTVASATPLAELIQRSRVLERLDVDKNELGARGVSEIAAVLQPSSSLRILRVRSGAESAGGADGIVALAAALSRGWKASELWLDRKEPIDDRCALALAAAMEQLGDRCTLTTLSLVYRSLTVEGALALVRAASRTPRLRQFDMRFGRSLSSAERLALLAARGPQPNFELNLPDCH